MKDTKLNIGSNTSVFINRIFVFVFATILFSCMGEVKENPKKANQGVSKATTIAGKAQDTKEDFEKLKDALPLTNEELKAWLPESIGNFKRTGFKVGAAGYANVVSIEGTCKSNDKD